MASAEDGRDSKPQSRAKEHTHGSVLMDIVKSQDQQPKQLTVGAKGMALQLMTDLSHYTLVPMQIVRSLRVLNLAIDI